MNTPVQYIQDNPKLEGSMSHSRYELYKPATSIAEYLRLHSGTKAQPYADLKHDFTHIFVLIPTTAAVRLIHPVLTLAAFHGPTGTIQKENVIIVALYVDDSLALMSRHLPDMFSNIPPQINLSNDQPHAMGGYSDTSEITRAH